jgi:hypothetical protein
MGWPTNVDLSALGPWRALVREHRGVEGWGGERWERGQPRQGQGATEGGAVSGEGEEG